MKYLSLISNIILSMMLCVFSTLEVVLEETNVSMIVTNTQRDGREVLKLVAASQ